MIVSPAGFLLVSTVPFRRLDLDFIQDHADSCGQEDPSLADRHHYL